MHMHIVKVVKLVVVKMVVGLWMWFPVFCHGLPRLWAQQSCTGGDRHVLSESHAHTNLACTHAPANTRMHMAE